MKVGDLVRVIYADTGTVETTGLYLGISMGLRENHMVLPFGKSRVLYYVEPNWKLEVI